MAYNNGYAQGDPLHDSPTGVYDEKIHPIESEKGGFHNDLETGGRPAHYRGKTNEYTVEIAPAGQERHVHDAVFGDMENGPNYRAVSTHPVVLQRLSARKRESGADRNRSAEVVVTSS